MKKKRRKRQKSLSSLRKLAWQLLSKIVRNKYAENGYGRCYTCAAVHPVSELQAGHAIGGRHNQVLFDESILRPQCVRCNVFMRGNYPVFAARLVREHGIDWWEQKLANAHELKIYTRSDLEERIESYRERLNQLQNPGALFDQLDGVK